MAGKNKKKIKDLDDSTKLLRDTTEEYDDTLRSIGQHYGEINKIYERSEKVLALVKGEISDILSITGLLNTSNAGLLENIVKSQKGYADISKDIVQNIASLEDSETAYKKISYQIEEQKQLIKDISKELENIDTSDEKQLLAAEELKKNLIAQSDALGKMKDAAKGVSKEMGNLNFVADKISGTMLGGWVDQFLNITKILGITDFKSIGEVFESIGKSDAKKALSSLQNTKDVEIKAPDEKTVENLTEVKDSQIKAPDEKTVENLTEVKDAQISAQKGNPTESVITGGPIEKQQTQGIESLGQTMQTVAKNTVPPKQKASVARLRSAGVKHREKQQIPEVRETTIDESKSIQINNSKETIQMAADTKSDTTSDMGSIGQAQTQTDFAEKETEKAEIKDREFQKQETNVADKTGKLIEETAKSAEGIPLFGPAIAGMAAAGVAAVALASELEKFEDSLGAVTALYTTFTFTKEGFEELTQSVITGNGKIAESFKKSVRDTKEFRELQFDFTIGADVKERQNLESDYFNYSKDVFFDYYNYQNQIVKDNVDYELGLRRDALNFQFQQQSANLDAELEKRKTLAGSAMKFIGNYAKVSERALNAIGSSTKAIMDGMKQFGAILGGTTKQQFSLINN